MDLTTGFQLEDPAVFVPWTVSEAGLRALLAPHGLRKVTTGYFTLSCRSLGGAEIRHFVHDRFGPEEHVRIRRSSHEGGAQER